jgi:hypothetical protein
MRIDGQAGRSDHDCDGNVLGGPPNQPADDRSAWPPVAAGRADHTSLDQALESLPIIQKLGSSVDTRAYAIRPYSEWAEELRVAVEGE